MARHSWWWKPLQILSNSTWQHKRLIVLYAGSFRVPCKGKLILLFFDWCCQRLMVKVSTTVRLVMCWSLSYLLRIQRIGYGYLAWIEWWLCHQTSSSNLELQKKALLRRSSLHDLQLGKWVADTEMSLVIFTFFQIFLFKRQQRIDLTYREFGIVSITSNSCLVMMTSWNTFLRQGAMITWWCSIWIIAHVCVKIENTPGTPRIYLWPAKWIL